MSKDLDRLPHRAMSLYSLQARAYRYRLPAQHAKRNQLTKVASDLGAVRDYPPPRLARPKKSVSFAPTISVISIVNTPVDLANAWYETAEYRQFEANRRITIAEINKVHGNLSRLDPTEHCVLGLEEHLNRKQVLVRKLKASHYAQLVLERLSSPVGDTKCASGIQALASMLSRHASQRAQWRAMLGQAEVA
jgi:hypothetical protein